VWALAFFLLAAPLLSAHVQGPVGILDAEKREGPSGFRHHPVEQEAARVECMTDATNPENKAGEAGAYGQLLDSVYRTLDVPAGHDYYVRYDSGTGTLKEMPLPDHTAGLCQFALDALDRTPEWLKEDLARRFGWLADEDIDVGDRSAPAFGDLDGDGDTDLAVGSSGGYVYFHENLDQALHYYEGEDVYVSAVYGNITSLYLGGSAGQADPALGDLDGDGDTDMVVGDQAGDLHYFEYDDVNESWTEVPGYLGSFSVAGYATPALADNDGDGDLDLTVGMSGGGLAYLRNDGTPTQPDWVRVLGYYAGVAVGGYSNPGMGDMDGDGDPDLVLGGSQGRLYYWRNSFESWSEDPALLADIDVGDYAAPAIHDMDLDLCPDLVVGAADGRLYYHENTGTAEAFETVVWTNPPTMFALVPLNNYYEETVTLKQRNDTYYQEYYGWLITTVEDDEVDELAFSIAHTATDILKNDDGDGEDVYPDVFRRNVQWIYDVAPHLDYVELVDRVGKEGQYSTLLYWVDDPELGRIQVELPPEIYYYFVVNPKIEDELPTFVDPDEENHLASNSEAPPNGRFWREYFWTHNDTGYPLLADLLDGKETVWDAIGGINTWIGQSLTFGDDGERPHEPVRIYRKHLGRCGEHADITTAAARTALIPSYNTGTISGDHTWNEFYDRGWHSWEPVNGYVDNPGVYHYGWGKDMAQVKGARSDHLLIDQTPYYHNEMDYGNLTIRVLDAEGEPVDGAKVSVGTWRYLVAVWTDFGDGWNYTDSNGECVLRIGECRQYADDENDIYNDGVEIHVASKYGGGTLNPGYENRYIIMAGEEEQHTIYLDGTLKRVGPGGSLVSPPAPGTKKLEFAFSVAGGVQNPPQAMNDDDSMLSYHEHFKSSGTHVDTFICDEPNFREYLKGKPFDMVWRASNSTGLTYTLDLPASGDWYCVLSNQDSVETSKRVEFSAMLYSGTIPTPAPPENVTAEIKERDLVIHWDHPANMAGVNHYRIYYSISYPPWEYSPIHDTTSDKGGRLATSYTIKGWGMGDYSNGYYYVTAISSTGLESDYSSPAGKRIVFMGEGWQLISLPFAPMHPEPERALNTILGTLDVVETYDAATGTWLSSGSGLIAVDHTMGLWVHLSEPDTLFIAGAVPMSTDIQLYAGWNLVGYPNQTTRPPEEALAGVSWEAYQTYYQGVAEPWMSNALEKPTYMNDDEAFYYTQGYWILCTEACVWTLEY